MLVSDTITIHAVPAGIHGLESKTQLCLKARMSVGAALVPPALGAPPAAPSRGVGQERGEGHWSGCPLKPAMGNCPLQTHLCSDSQVPGSSRQKTARQSALLPSAHCGN